MQNEAKSANRNLISSQEAARRFGYSQDYIGQLARKGKIEAVKTSGSWHINEDSLIAHFKEADEAKKKFGGRPMTRRLAPSEIGRKALQNRSTSRVALPRRRQSNPIGGIPLVSPDYLPQISSASAHAARVAHAVPPVLHVVDVLHRSLFIAFFIALVAGSAHASFTTIVPPSYERLQKTVAVVFSNSFATTLAAGASILPCAGIEEIASLQKNETISSNNALASISAAAVLSQPMEVLHTHLCTD